MRKRRPFSQAQMYALSAMQGRDNTDFVRANTLESLVDQGLCWQDRQGFWYLTIKGDERFEAAGGYEATWGLEPRA